jgi:L-threonylcarbamoyladenylate synthase
LYPKKPLFTPPDRRDNFPVETRVMPIETAAQFESAAAESVRLLRESKLVALPTETVYGLAANALDAGAVELIYEVKGRPAHNPIIVHVSSLKMARRCVTDWPQTAEKLARQFWPGPLTLVLPRSEIIPAVVTAGGKTVGVRFPLHPFVRRVIQLCDFPVAAPSANPANQLSPTTADHVRQSLNGRIPLIVDAGPTSIGIESTVLDLTTGTPAVLRPGMISAKQIAAALGSEVRAREHSDSEPGVLRSPGRLEKHYSPRARLVLASWNSDTELLELASRHSQRFGITPKQIHIIACERIPHANPFGRVAIIPHDSEAYARAIYAELHRSDGLGAALILVEMPPSGDEWDGIRDRLLRASA